MNLRLGAHWQIDQELIVPNTISTEAATKKYNEVNVLNSYLRFVERPGSN
jgi:hypothetical protein